MQDQPPYNEQELLRQLAEGSEDAFRVLFHAYRHKLYAYILKLSGSAETASDTVNEIFLRIWQRREQAEQIGSLGSYLFRMAHNEAYQIFRRRAKETLILAELQKEKGMQAGFEGEDRVTHREVLAFIRGAVNKLTPQQKQVFLLSREQGMRLAEIAERLQISERTVKNHMTSAMKFLREEMRGQYGDLATILLLLYPLAETPAYHAAL